MTALELVLGALLTYRLVRLWQTDAVLAPFVQPLEQRLDRRAHRPGLAGRLAAWFLDLTSCAWCLSVWVGAGVYDWWHLHPPSFRIAAAIATFSTVTGFLASRDH